MPESKAKEVAKLFGLELEEEFELKDMYGGRYKWTNGGLMSRNDTIQEWIYSLEFNNILAGNLEIVKLSKPILTEKEKEYLSSVIKPFRDRILHIFKFDLMGYEGIGIDLKFPKVESYDDAMTLPSFEKGTMYKGMEANKDYTLEELGL